MLLVVVRAPGGRVRHVPIGRAYLHGNSGGAISLLPARYPGEECLEEFFCDTPRQARAAFELLAELGDVDVHRKDFEIRWYNPRGGIAAVEALLTHQSRKARALLTGAVRTELEQLRSVLEVSQSLGYSFYLADVERGASTRFAGAEWRWQENKRLHQTSRARKTRHDG